MLQFLRYAADTGSTIQAEAVQQIADAMVADSKAVASQTSDAERARSIKALRGELRGKEFELDGLIKSLIDFPPKTAQTDTAMPPPDDPKSSLKARIAEVTALVNALRARLSALEADD